MDKNKITDEYIELSLRKLDDNIKLPNNLKSIDRIIENKKTKNIKTRSKAAITAASFLIFIVLGSLTVLSKPAGSIFNSMFVDKGVIKSEIDGKVSSVEKICEKNGVKVTLKGVVSDGIRTVISIRFDSKNVNFEDFKLSNVSLIDGDGKKYEMFHYGQGVTAKGEDNFETAIEFKGSPSKKITAKLNIGSINDIKGDWDFDFDINPSSIESYKASGVYNDSKIALTITSVKITGTYTIVEGNMKGRDIDIYSVLSNSNGDKVGQVSGEMGTTKDFKLYYPPLTKTDKLNLTIKTADQTKVILSTDINLDK
ncbi:hypothetical protein CSC2_39550 [Clostridium zeae]|uniref:DUF4179 domain-containing protein n=1 Tax=Clostridium zeae TaxID=2759022 RepID=A0ABQ1EFB3_9CLOT|nr:DUF4179 domain-containing protein [Clostridium zeae]GFZ33429.1 hypothetical protein CSC2_39550 [Clostridium zeae]